MPHSIYAEVNMRNEELLDKIDDKQERIDELEIEMDQVAAFVVNLVDICKDETKRREDVLAWVADEIVDRLSKECDEFTKQYLAKVRANAAKQ